MKVVILEDDYKWNNKIKDYLLQFQFLNDVDFEIEQVFSINELFECKDVQLFLLDIDINHDNILNRYSELLSKYPNSFIVYITSYLSYMPFAFGMNVLKYIDKNHLKRLDDVLMYVLNHFKQKSIKIKSKDNDFYIKFNDIYYIEYVDRKFYLHTHTDAIRIYESSIKNIMERLTHQFMLINKHEIVNLDKVVSINKGQLLLENKERVFYVSRRKYKEVCNMIVKWQEEHMYDIFK